MILFYFIQVATALHIIMTSFMMALQQYIVDTKHTPALCTTSRLKMKQCLGVDASTLNVIWGVLRYSTAEYLLLLVYRLSHALTNSLAAMLF